MHVVGIFHATLDLERAHACRQHFFHVIERTQVLGAQQALTHRGQNLAILVAHELIRQTARLGTQTSVCRAATTHGAHETDARIAKTNGTMPKALKLDAGGGALAHLVKRKLARQRHASRALLGTPQDTARVMHVGLGRNMQLKLRHPPVELRKQPPVLDDGRICPQLVGVTGNRHGIFHLILAHHDVEREIHASAGDMGLAAQSRKGFVIDFRCFAAGIQKATKRAIDGIGPRRKCRAEGIRAAGGSQKLDVGHFGHAHDATLVGYAVMRHVGIAIKYAKLVTICQIVLDDRRQGINRGLLGGHVVG